MARRQRVRTPPTTLSSEVHTYLDELAAAINQLPNFSISSTTNGPESTVTGDPGTILIDVGSAVTKAWVKQGTSAMTGWRELDNYALSSIATYVPATVEWFMAHSYETSQTISNGASEPLKFEDYEGTSNISPAADNTIFYVNAAGPYMIVYHSAFSAGSANDTWEFHLHSRGAELPFCDYVDVGAVGNHYSANFQFVDDITSGQTFSVHAEHDNGSPVELNIHHQSLTITAL